MTGDVIIVTILLLIVAAVAFLPLGFFIYLFSKDSKHPFGKPHGASHGMTPSMEKADPYLQKLLGDDSYLQILFNLETSVDHGF